LDELIAICQEIVGFSLIHSTLKARPALGWRQPLRELELFVLQGILYVTSRRLHGFGYDRSFNLCEGYNLLYLLLDFRKEWRGG
jgi:hypothetical protein